MTDEIKPTERTKLKRRSNRGSFDRETINSILDEGFICHVGFVSDGQPFVIPTAYGRSGNSIYLHGAAVSRMMRELSKGIDVCVTVTLVDGLVMARSAFHHSMNYRSVVIFGKAIIIENETEKNEALFAFTEHLVAGRWDDVRPPDANELKGTTVLRLDLNEASAKIRTGEPIDDAEDMNLNVWAGVIPLTITSGEPVNDALLADGIEVPEYAKNYQR